MAFKLSAVVLLAFFSCVIADQICEQFGQIKTDRYVIMNNRWGSSAEQCIETNGNSFRIVRQDGFTQGGAPLSYPGIYFGCHYTSCSPGTNLPMQLNQIQSVRSSVSYNFADGVYDAAYDIWLDPRSDNPGNQAMEIMIWLNRQGQIQPVGGVTGSVNIAGIEWQIWQGSNGSNNVISYVAPSPVANLDFDVLAFINDAKNRGLYDNNWFLTSIQCGFEPWSGGIGLAVNSFSASVN